MMSMLLQFASICKFLASDFAIEYLGKIYIIVQILKNVINKLF